MSTAYRRVDLAIEIHRGQDGAVELRGSAPSPGGESVARREHALPAPEVRAWADGAGDAGAAAAEVRALLAMLAGSWVGAARAEGIYEGAPVIPRILLRTLDPADARLPWETLLAAPPADAGLPLSAAVVRDTPVRPRAELVAFKLPLRVLEVARQRDLKVPKALARIFGGEQPARVAKAVQAASVPPRGLGAWRPTAGRPTVEVLHFHALPTLADPRLLLSTARAGTPGTLGWLMRFADAAQTRLVVVRCADAAAHRAARALGAALTARGGPALLALGAGVDPLDLYAPLILDHPLDRIVAESLAAVAAGACTLFAGAGREEALRIAPQQEELKKFGERVAAGDPEAHRAIRVEMKRIPGPADPIRRHIQHLERTIRIAAKKPPGTHGKSGHRDIISTGRTLDVVRRQIRVRPPLLGEGFERTVGPAVEGGSDLDFGFSEDLSRAGERGRSGRGRGTSRGGRFDRDITLDIPGRGDFRDEARWWRDAFGDVTEDRPRARPRRGSRKYGTEPPRASPESGAPEGEASWVLSPSSERERRPRFVNPSLWEEVAGATPRRIPAKGARLRVGETYHLGVRIGPEEEDDAPVVGARHLVEELFFDRPQQSGRWIEVGVTGLDFEVLGDPVQELWLPREEPTALLRFAVRPLRAGVSRLRFCIYRGQDVVQSFRLAALTTPADGAAKGGAGLLAGALGLRRGDVGSAGWLARLEYSLTADAASPPERPGRAVSIVANDLDGETVVTLKAEDTYFVRTVSDVSFLVQKARDALDEIATLRPEGEKKPAYAFGRAGGGPNAGDDAQLREALTTLAQAGWELYTQLVPGAERERLKGTLNAPGQVIHVAHVLLKKVVPWSLLYDAEFDRSGAEACLAALPGSDGSPGATACGTHPGCLLHRERAARGGPPLAEKRVACPLHLWGFKHQVEIPLQQVPPGGKARQVAERVLSERPVQLVAGLNERLSQARTHLAALEKLVEELGGAADWRVKEFERDAILDRLAGESELDVIYLYCHARGGRADPRRRYACLEFRDAAGKPGQITSGNLAQGSYWTHHPLVVLNGCGTVAFSPDALSDFLPVLVQDRGAAGLLGTEISVWEALAGEFAYEFLRAFLGGASAGKALLAARHALLAQRNPLGLAYTLYADADLQLQGAPVPSTTPTTVRLKPEPVED